jgi:hypothetical protein
MTEPEKAEKVTVINRIQRFLIPGHGPLERSDEPVEVPRGDVVDELIEVGALEVPEGQPVKGHNSSFAHLSLTDLKTYAAEHEIDLGSATKKPDVLELIEQAAVNTTNEEER